MPSTYRITISDDLDAESEVPQEPTLPLTDPESSIEGWELVSTTWQHVWAVQQDDARSFATYAVVGRFVWTWKAIYKQGGTSR
jgi:hypothetical protein